MAEAIHCPSCSTRYRLRPERLKPVIRRAKCFSCGGLFPVGDIVQRLLALPAQGATAEATVEDAEGMQHTPLDSEITPPSLTLGDLEGVEEEILEKTLVVAPTALPEVKAEATPEPILAPPEPMALPEPTAAPEPAPAPEPVAVRPDFPPEITETTLSGYTSARDAIDKLFGGAPARSAGPKSQQDSNAMDMEATLSALESTLGGVVLPTSPSVATGTLGDSPTDSGVTGEDLAGPSTSTVRLSQADLLAALAAPAAPRSPSVEPTVALNASDLFPSPDRRAEGAASSPSRTFAPVADTPDTGAELLRLKIGEDIYGSLTMPQLIAWVEEGRILESHLVARQHSENWLEAQKVPGLRPVFERLRRDRSGSSFSLDSGIGDIAPKKSLFGGLFGKN